MTLTSDDETVLGGSLKRFGHLIPGPLYVSHFRPFKASGFLINLKIPLENKEKIFG